MHFMRRIVVATPGPIVLQVDRSHDFGTGTLRKLVAKGVAVVAGMPVGFGGGVGGVGGAGGVGPGALRTSSPSSDAIVFLPTMLSI